MSILSLLFSSYMFLLSLLVFLFYIPLVPYIIILALIFRLILLHLFLWLDKMLLHLPILCILYFFSCNNSNILLNPIFLPPALFGFLIIYFIKLVRFVFFGLKAQKKRYRQVALPPGEKLYFWIYHKQVYDKSRHSIFHLPLAYFIR